KSAASVRSRFSYTLESSMLINHDFTRRVTVSCDDYYWVHSPQTGIDRVMLDRIGGEQARATSLVRYLPQTSFPEHQHPGGEEILVLEGQLYSVNSPLQFYQ
ncbi:cupin domain-containing protein, partial [Klebsiella pneumoniae]|uniref:cupin domain-containing protein n=2 Tax=Klebsiella pneumoniae TaxID=573 RepID=UPI0021645EC2